MGLASEDTYILTMGFREWLLCHETLQTYKTLTKLFKVLLKAPQSDSLQFFFYTLTE